MNGRSKDPGVAQSHKAGHPGEVGSHASEGMNVLTRQGQADKGATQNTLSSSTALPVEGVAQTKGVPSSLETLPKGLLSFYLKVGSQVWPSISRLEFLPVTVKLTPRIAITACLCMLIPEDSFKSPFPQVPFIQFETGS